MSAEKWRSGEVWKQMANSEWIGDHVEVLKGWHLIVGELEFHKKKSLNIPDSGKRGKGG